MHSEFAIIPYPKAPIWRRGAALGIDCLAVGLISALIGRGPLVWLFAFMLSWMGLRVVAAALSHGQSLGRWAFDMKVIERGSGRIPELLALSKREVLVGLGCALALIGLTHITPMSNTAAVSLLTPLPLLADCGLAFTDPLQQQTFHDRVANTQVVKTQRGYSLELKVKRWFAYIRQYMRK